MDDEEVSFYSKLNRKKTEKKPILRVQLKKSKQIFYSNSTRDINRNNFFNPERKQYNKNNIANEEIKKISKNDQLKKYDSISYFHKNYNDDKYKNKKKPKDKYIYQRNSNSIEKYFNIKKNWKKEVEINSDDFKKCIELPGYKYVYITKEGKVYDFRPEEGKPSFNNLMKLNDIELHQYIVKGLKAQLDILNKKNFNSEKNLRNQIKNKLKIAQTNLNILKGKQ